MTRKVRSAAKKGKPNYIRASISFPSGIYQLLAEIAKQKKVSLAWVVRDAAEKYVGNQPTLTNME
jgi:hypothetical protein